MAPLRAASSGSFLPAGWSTVAASPNVCYSSSPMLVILAYFACAILWSTTWYAIRVSIEPGGYPTYLSAAIRFTVAAAVLALALLLGFGRQRLSWRQAAWLVLAGFLNTAGYALVYRAEQEISGGLAAVLYSTMPIITAILAAVTGTERPRPSAIVGALVGVAGVAVIFWERLNVSRAQGLGVIFVLLSVTAASLYSVVLKSKTADVHPLTATAVFFPAAAGGLWLLTLVLERHAPPWPPSVGSTLAVVYLAIFGSVITFAAYFYLLRHVTLATLTTLVFLEPIGALLVDALLERRAQIGTLTYVGAAITVSGVLTSVLFGRAYQSAG